MVLPFFGGARSPLNDEKAAGLIAGLTLSHTRTDIYRALLEGVGYEARHNFEVMREAGVAPRRIIAVGGGTKSAVWTQIVSDILGREQSVCRSLGAPLGASYLAGLGTGLIPSISHVKENFVKMDRVVKPGDFAGEYQKYYQIYRSLYENSKEVIANLTELNV